VDTHIFIRGVEQDGQLRTFTEEKLTRTVERFEDHILSATVRVEDETGPAKHGVDKICRIDIKLRTGDIHIKEQGEEFHATISVALDRLKAVLSRETAKAKRGVGEG
jgi:ribosomal subunit interface protein